MLVFLSTLPWRYDVVMSISNCYMLQHNMVNIMQGLRKTFLKNDHGLFAYTSLNCYVHINYAP